nr:HAMP domain-containing sensor histidine kinase [Deinococcus sp. DB0503]
MLLSHVLIVVVALGALLLCAEVLAPAFIRSHVEQMIALIGPSGADLRPDLERGMRATLSSALLASLPLALLVAAVTALPSARRVVRSVGLLRDGSRALAAGRYEQRLPEEGNDELTDLARHFNRMAAALGQLEQERTELIANVAHELRTPIAALRGYTEALADGVMDPVAAREALQREVSALERLARDLSLVSQVERGRLELHLSTFSPADLLQAARERFEGAYDEKGVELGVQLPPGLPPVRADFGRAAQVLANLLTNALRHTPPGGQVTVGAVADGPFVQFLVTDTGSGIAAEHLPRVFERFYRADPARSRADGGSGVGLTIARGLVERMGGHIRAESVPGQGSRFAFTLPAAPGGEPT